MTKEELRTRVEAEILSGVEPVKLADMYEVPYVTIIGWKKKLLAEKSEVDISKLTSQTSASLEIIKEVAQKQAPIVANKISAIIDGVQGLKELEPEFHKSLTSAVRIAQEFLDMTDEDGKTELSIKEWQLITSTLASAYGTLFNKSGTTVNVAQTNVSTANENLAFFQASKKSI